MFAQDAKIIVVEDSDYTLRAIKDRLAELKFTNVLGANGLKQAQALLQEEAQRKRPPQLLITDLNMPGGSGLDLLRWVRARVETQLLPVILLTTSQNKDDIVQAGVMGVSHYIVKPLSVEILRDKMASAWQKHGQKYLESLDQRQV